LKYIAKTLFGLEEILVSEIEGLGGKNVEKLNRAVSFEGDLECLYKVNFWSRLALRVVMPIMQFTAHNETVFYKRIRRYNWTDLFSLDQTFCVDSTVKSEYFRHSKYVALKTKDAINDLFRLKHNDRRPNIDTRNPDFRINVHCYEKEFTISLDSSGTLLTEALSIAHNLPPRPRRNSYAFMKWADYDRGIWKSIVEESKKDHIPDFPKIFGSDVDRRQLDETQQLLDDIGFSKISLNRKNFINSLPPKASGMIITNPPYGERLGEGRVMELYQNIGDTLKKNYAGWKAWMISSNKDAIKKVGLKPSRKITLFNGALECKFQKYEMYEGSKKDKNLRKDGKVKRKRIGG